MVSRPVSFEAPGSLAGRPRRCPFRKRRSHCTKSSKFDGVSCITSERTVRLAMIR